MKERARRTGRNIRVKVEPIRNRFLSHINDDHYRQYELAILLDVSPCVLSKFMNAPRKSVRLREGTIRQICENLGIPIDAVTYKNQWRGTRIKITNPVVIHIHQRVEHR